MGVTPGTRPTGTALKAASVAGGPEVSAAAKTAQARRKAREDIANNPRVTPGDGHDDTAAPAPQAPPPTSSGGGVSVPVPAAAATGSGFLLGLFGWALGLAYLQHGAAGVKQLLAAKFLNKTTTGA